MDRQLVSGGLRLLGSAAVVAALLACEPEDPCQEYIDYMCACHEDVDCDQLEQTLDSPDAEGKNQCAIDLDETQAADEEAGLECAV